MNSTEDMEVRLEMRDMHDFFLDKIKEAMKGGNYFEAAWLEYSCLENRYFRTLDKYKNKCKYCKGKCRSKKNELALRTKVRCVERLIKKRIRCISESFSREQISDTISWIKKRNNLMHSLLALESYQESFTHSFQELAREGYNLVIQTYQSCTKFREIFFSDNYEFNFPEECMNLCPCNVNTRESTKEP